MKKQHYIQLTLATLLPDGTFFYETSPLICCWHCLDIFFCFCLRFYLILLFIFIYIFFSINKTTFCRPKQRKKYNRCWVEGKHPTFGAVGCWQQLLLLLLSFVLMLSLGLHWTKSVYQKKFVNLFFFALQWPARASTASPPPSSVIFGMPMTAKVKDMPRKQNKNTLKQTTRGLIITINKGGERNAIYNNKNLIKLYIFVRIEISLIWEMQWRKSNHFVGWHIA